jgi:chaperonin GroES
MAVEPLYDRVVIEPLEEEEVTAGGIVLPDTAKEKPQRGRVVAVGPGKLTEDGERIAPVLKEGDQVLFGKFAGTEVSIDDKEYTIMRESEILAKIEP